METIVGCHATRFSEMLLEPIEASVREMMEYLKARKIPAQYDVADLDEDMKNFYKRVGR